MQTMFLINLIIGSNLINSNHDSNVMTFSNFPIENVYIGEDRNMELYGDKVISIKPTIVNGRIKIPENINEAMLELSKMLPMWFKIALLNGKNEYECLVSVNEISIDSSISVWIRKNWDLENADSKLSKVISLHGVNGSDWQRADFLHEKFCSYLKTTKKKGVRPL